MKKLLVPFILLSVLVAAVGCSPWGTRPVVKIGLVAPFEGLYRALGYEVLPAVKLAVRECNSAGGVNGYMVELVALNDDQEPGVAVSCAREMAADPDIMGVIGHFDEATTLAALSTYHEAGLALVVPGARAVQVTRAGYPEVFRLGADNNLLGATAARYAVIEKGARRLAVVRGQEDLVDSFREAALQRGAAVVLDADAVDDRLMSMLAKKQPDMIFFGGDALEAADLLLQLRSAGPDTPLLGGDGLNSPFLIQVAGEAALGTTYVTMTPPVEDQAFVESYTALAGAPPGPYAALAYDAARLLLSALEESVAQDGRTTRRGVVAALSRAHEFDGLTGILSFDERGQEVNPRVYTYEIVDQQYPGELREE